MTVKELINKLQELPEDHKIVMSKDAEGNSYSPLSNISEGVYVADSTWSGDYYDTGDAEEEEIEGAPVICLWPVN